MGQSLVKKYLHIVFRMKNRKPLIWESIENELYACIGGIYKNFECHPIKTGGYTNYIHLPRKLSGKVAPVKLLKEMKSHSAEFIKT